MNKVTGYSFHTAPQEVGTVTITTSSSTGFSAIWERPSIPNGLIIQYQVIASPIYTTGLVAPNGNVVTATLNIEV